MYNIAASRKSMHWYCMSVKITYKYVASGYFYCNN